MASSKHQQQRKKTKKNRHAAPHRVKKARQEAKESAVAVVDEIVCMSTEEKCNLIAELSESILENPNQAFVKIDSEEEHVTEVSKMRRLLELANELKNGHDAYISKLSLLSLLALFQDILPSYRIRLPTAAEAAVRVTKETKALWDYERSLLTHYQQYLKLLERTRERGSQQQPPSALAVTSILCLCQLLQSAPHFNFRSNILSVVVRQMNNPADEISTACCQAVEHVFKTDAQGEISLEAARMVAKAIQNRNYKVKPKMLATFKALPLRVHVDEAQAAKIAAAANAKKRKRDKAGAELQSDLQESTATVDKIVLARSQADTLEVVILTYFRILKSNNLEKMSELLPPALEGLAKFAHLINIDTVVDLLGVLKDLLQSVDALPLDAALYSVLTAFQTLQGPGREMQIDQKEYVTPLYNQLPRLCSESSGRKHTDIVLQCLNAALIKRREYSTVRVAAFCKRLLNVSLHTPAQTSAPLLAFCRLLLQRYPSVHQMLENEQDVITSGQYDAIVQDPEHCNPFATSAWELSLLKFHIHPTVADHATGAACLKMLQFPAQAPERVRADLVRDADELYIHSRRVQKKHPLAPRENKRRRTQVRFITLRKTIIDLNLL